jgi:hypothetical protein
MREFIDANGTRYFVSPGISRDGHTWMTVYQKRGANGTHRAKNLPIVETRDEAQKLLDEYAAKKHLRESKL